MKCAYVPPYVDPFADDNPMKKDASKLVAPVKPKIEGTYGGTYKKNLENIDKISE